MEVRMIDARDEDLELFKGDLTVVPNLGDWVFLNRGVDEPIGRWRVTGRSMLLLLDRRGQLVKTEDALMILMLHPGEGGEWDGSAEAYLDSEVES
jgi:hypothetical protein